MLVFYGLGNNESKYFKTKHNAGRVLLENLAEIDGLTFQKAQKYSYCKTRWGSQDVYFVFSSGYMNLSGEALSAFLKYFKLELSDPSDFLVVLQDDSDQIEGNNKFMLGGGSAGHRGIDSIYKFMLGFKLDISRLWRLKIGIRPALNTLKSETFVLNSLSDLDNQNLQALTKLIGSNKKHFETLSFEKIQMSINTKPNY
jgi:aminoacyl-tRNA hydrolase